MKITEEQWKCLLGLAKLGFAAQPAIKASNDFIAGMKQIEVNAGLASEQLPGLQSAILDMAKQEEQ